MGKHVVAWRVRGVGGVREVEGDVAGTSMTMHTSDQFENVE
jgi:hypothetical protein